MRLRVVFEEDERGWVTGYCPDLRGCVSQGRGIDDARANIKEAIEGYLEVVLEDAVKENVENSVGFEGRDSGVLGEGFVEVNVQAAGGGQIVGGGTN